MPAETLPWNDENFCQVLTNIYAEVAHDPALHQQFTTDPFSVLSQRIDIPPHYQKNFFTKPHGNPGILISVPPYQGAAAAGATPAAADPEAMKPNYAVLCTTTLW